MTCKRKRADKSARMLFSRRRCGWRKQIVKRYAKRMRKVRQQHNIGTRDISFPF